MDINKREQQNLFNQKTEEQSSEMKSNENITNITKEKVKKYKIINI